MNRHRLLLAAALAASLTACARSEPEAAPENVAAESPTTGPIVTDPIPPEAPAPPAPAVEANATAELPPEAAAAPDEQMLDDASATGMTARAARGEEEAPAANTTDE
jgi:hypothetical protein